MTANPQAEDTFDPWRAIPASEFRERQDRLRRAAADAGYDGAVVFSRGGAFVDQFQDALYLTNHYSQQPAMGDETGIGSARAHAAVVVPVDGPSTVVVDVPWWRRDLVVADDVRPSIDVIGTAAAAVRDAGLADRRLALVGASFMTAAAYIGLREQLPDTTLIREDRLVELLRIHKSPAEIEVIRRACALGSRSMDAMMEAVVEGATEAEAVAAAAQTLYAGGGTLYDAACASGPNAHGYTHARLPSADPIRRMERGDLFHVDFYGAYGGYYFDFARARVVGDEPTDTQRRLVEGTIECVEHICDAIRPGMTAGELYAVGEAWMGSSELVRSIPEETPEMEGFPAFGHGIGLMWEGPWVMPGEPTPLEPGMHLGIELLLGHPSIGGAMFEQNVLVADDGFELLTHARKRWW
jgi:Xaa-Pro aminopeptidase